MERTFEQYAKAGASHDIMDALKLLTDAYVMECGVSLGNRTALYYAGEVWQEKLAWLDLPLSEIARNTTLVEMMPLLSDSYTPDCDEYDITRMNAEELIQCCKEIINDHGFNEGTLEVLCWGINEYATRPKFEPYDIETLSLDGKPLKGRVLSLYCGRTMVKMTSPFQNICASRDALIKNPEEILIDAYIDYYHFCTAEKDYKKLYDIYKEQYPKCKSKYEKAFLFRNVYKEILRECVLCNPEELMTKLYGMEFYDSLGDKDPSWYTESCQ